MCGKVLIWLPMKRMSSLILLLVRLVFRRNEFLVVFRQVRVWDRKSAGRARVVMVCGAGADKISQTLEGAGRERTKKFNPHRTLV